MEQAAYKLYNPLALIGAGARTHPATSLPLAAPCGTCPTSLLVAQVTEQKDLQHQWQMCSAFVCVGICGGAFIWAALVMFSAVVPAYSMSIGARVFERYSYPCSHYFVTVRCW